LYSAASPGISSLLSECYAGQLSKTTTAIKKYMVFCKGNIANAFTCSQASLIPDEMRKKCFRDPLT